MKSSSRPFPTEMEKIWFFYQCLEVMELGVWECRL